MSLERPPVVNLYWLTQIQSEHHAAVGFKALYLSSLCQIKCPVVPGFVISSQVLATVVEAIDWKLPLLVDFPQSSLRVNRQDGRQLQAIAQHLRQAIAEATLPADLVEEISAAIAQFGTTGVILRPSLVVEPMHLSLMKPPLAAVMFHTSGLIQSRICVAQPQAVMSGLKQLWGDVFGAKSLFYWQQYNIPLQQVKLAVLVQPLYEAIAAGTVRWVDQQIQVSATVGMGTAIARSELVPDTYLVHPDTGSIVSQRLGQKSVGYRLAPREDGNTMDGLLQMEVLDDDQRLNFTLTVPQIQQLARRFQTVMAELGTVVELEWLLTLNEVGKLQDYLTQVVPQPTLPTPVPDRPAPTASGDLFADAVLMATGVAAAPGQAIAPASVVLQTDGNPAELPSQMVLVAPLVPLEWLPLLPQVAGVVAEQGSFTSHCAIVARELGVPAVMGVPQVTQQLKTGDWIWIDGDRGRVYRLPTPANPSAPPSRSAPASLLPAEPSAPPPLGTRLWVNLSQIERLDMIAQLPVDGVGLVRSELLAMSVLEQTHPAQWVQQQSAAAFVERWTIAIAKIAQTFAPRPVLYRSFDLRATEFAHRDRLPGTAHSTLGVRGTLSYLLDPHLFQLELQSLVAVQRLGLKNVRLLLPFVRSLEEFQQARQWVEQAGLLRQTDFQLWMMAEVPSVLLLLPEYVQAGVQGISIGTNDLTQLLLGINREDAELAMLYEERHPAVKRAIAHLIQTARSLGIPCSLCGEAPVHHPDLIPDLVRWGIDSISVAPEAVAATHHELSRAEQKFLLEHARSPETLPPL